MHLINYEGHSYVKLEVVYTVDNYSVDVRFNVGLLNVTTKMPEYGVWDAELCPEVKREPQYETELLSSILDQLLVDRYIHLDDGLLESIGIYPTRIRVSLNVRHNERRRDFIEKIGGTQREVRKLIEKAVTDFTTLKV